MRLTPIVALVDDKTVAVLGPIVSELAGLIADSGNLALMDLMVKYGWTPEAMAWGRILDAAATLELAAVAIEAGQQPPATVTRSGEDARPGGPS